MNVIVSDVPVKALCKYITAKNVMQQDKNISLEIGCVSEINE